jgi:hypothetical protein
MEICAQQRSSAVITPAACSTSCSQLSTMSKARLHFSAPTSNLSGSPSPLSFKPIAWATVVGMYSPLVRGANSMNHTPSPEPSSSLAPTCSEVRVFPIPPDPVTVTSRLSFSILKDAYNLRLTAQKARVLKREVGPGRGENGWLRTPSGARQRDNDFNARPNAQFVANRVYVRVDRTRIDEERFADLAAGRARPQQLGDLGLTCRKRRSRAIIHRHRPRQKSPLPIPGGASSAA